MCDVGEPYDNKTGVDGRFSISYNSNLKNVNLAPIVAEPGSDTYDSNIPGEPFVLKLIAPRIGDSLVSVTPLSTVAGLKVVENFDDDNPPSEENITEIKTKVQEALDLNEDIVKVNPSDPEILVKAVTVSQLLEENASGIVEDLVDNDKNLTDIVPEVSDIIEKITDSNTTLSDAEIQQLTQAVINTDIDIDEVNLSDVNNINKTIFIGYLDGIYNEFNSSGLIEEFNLTEWNSTSLAESLMDNNISSLDDLIAKMKEDNFVIDDINLSSVYEMYNRILNMKRVKSIVGEEYSEDINLTQKAVYDIQTGEPIEFYDDGTYKVGDKTGKWWKIGNVLDLNDTLYGVITSVVNNNYMFNITYVDSNNEKIEKTMLSTPFMDGDFNETAVNEIFANNYLTIDSLRYIYMILNIEGSSITLNDDGTTSNRGTWEVLNSSSFKITDNGYTYYLILKTKNLDNFDAYVLKVNGEGKVEYIKESLIPFSVDVEQLKEMLKEEDEISLLPISDDMFANKNALIEGKLFKFYSDHTLDVSYLHFLEKGSPLVLTQDHGYWKIIDNTLLEVQYAGDVYFMAVNEDEGYFYKVLNFEKSMTDYFANFMVFNNLDSIEVNSTDELVEGLNGNPALLSDVNGSIYYANMFINAEDDGVETTCLYFKEDGRFIDYTNYIDEWKLDNNIVSIYGGYIIPVNEENGVINAFYVEYDEDEHSISYMFPVQLEKATSFPLKYSVGNLFGYTWNKVVAWFKDDMSFYNESIETELPYVTIKASKNSIDSVGKAEANVELNNANYLKATLETSLFDDYTTNYVMVTTPQSLTDENGSKVSLMSKVTLSEYNITVSGEVNTDENTETFDVGSCSVDDLNNTKLSVMITTNGKDMIYYNVFTFDDNDNESSICQLEYNISESNLEGVLSFDNVYIGTQIITNDNAQDYNIVNISDFEAYAISSENIASILGVTLQPITKDNFVNKILVTDVYSGDLEDRDYLIFGTDSVFDVEDNASYAWNVENNILQIQSSSPVYVGATEVNGSVYNVKGIDLEDGLFTDTVLVVNANEDTIVNNPDDFKNLFDNEFITLDTDDINGTAWDVVSSDNSEVFKFNDDGTFEYYWSVDGNDFNLTGTWEVNNSVIVVDLDRNDYNFAKAYYGVYKEDNLTLIGVIVDSDGDVEDVNMKELVPQR
ncbi:hypothetical protein [Nautilia sp. PV-1]|uniref:hypothetical protein n=1 Tax=Nautilia sp. PV-1 TaxID=2579250 RepID=UPI00143C08A2|nr:hypothetical protein [Nautilia sp. PV-1]